jgi:hypothetical protein
MTNKRPSNVVTGGLAGIASGSCRAQPNLEEMELDRYAEIASPCNAAAKFDRLDTMRNANPTSSDVDLNQFN